MPITALSTVSAVLFCAWLVYLGHGLQSMILPLRGVAESFPTLVLGLLGTSFSLGFVAGCLYGPLVIRRVGHIRALAVFAAITANVALGFALLVHPIAWIILRAISGIALAGMFLVIESWLHERADNHNRGKIFSAYLVINSTGVVAGQMLVGVGDPLTFHLFALAAILLSCALIPVSLTTATTPAPLQRVTLRLGHLYRVSPVGVAGALLVGISTGTFGTMGAVFVTTIGFSAFEVALFASAALAGATLMQVPTGALSDRFDRRWVIIGLAITASAVGWGMGLSDGDGPASSLAAWLGISVTWTWIIGAFCFGAFATPIYGVAMAHMNDRISSDGFVEAASGFLLLWGLGAALGPFLGSLAMELISVNALFLVTGLAHISLATFTLLRILQRAAPLPQEKTHFEPAGADRTTPEALPLDPRSSA